MKSRPFVLAGALAMAALALAGCEKKAADGAAVAQGRAPEGTISDELPNMELLPNDAPLADPADLPPGAGVPGVPGVPGAAGEPAAGATPPDAATPAPATPAPVPSEPAIEGSIAQ